MPQNKAYLLIGGNIGDRMMALSNAREAIEKHCGDIIRKSSVYETAAWGNEDQAAFLNQALEIETDQTAEELLKKILESEEILGRKRALQYGPRIIDIDVLFFNNNIIQHDGLKVPHPRMQYRRFVLVPLNEIAPGMIHPVLQKSVNELLMQCTDPLAVNKFN
ncbi:MAG: 2-amino-4-hydroxy-6-hydroxymethyldihydropteridine diphosphokinase [Flavisolibacter sp.]